MEEKEKRKRYELLSGDKKIRYSLGYYTLGSYLMFTILLFCFSAVFFILQTTFSIIFGLFLFISSILVAFYVHKQEKALDNFLIKHTEKKWKKN